MILYRVYTEDKSNLAEIAAKYFDGFTVLKGTGYWKGKIEFSAIIEILTSNNVYDNSLINDLAEDIRRENKQEAILVTDCYVNMSVVQ